MDTEIIIQAISLFLLVVLSGFFSSSETALTTVNKVKLEELSILGNKRAKTALKILENPTKMISTILIANNVVNISASALATTIAIKIGGNSAVAIGTGILTLVVLIFGEITPKTLASVYNLEMSLLYSGVILLLRKILTPVIVLVDGLANLLLKMFKVDGTSVRQAMTEYEFRSVVEASTEDGVIEQEEQKMIYNVVDFGDSLAKDIMIPRTEMSSISVDATYEDLKELFLKDKYTRMPVYEESTDNIIGIINVKDIVFLSPENFAIRDHMREANYTFEHKKTSELLSEMKENSISICMVLDEYGATVGLVTLEDLLEEIVGEIRDEYDEAEKELIKEVDENTYSIPGSMKLDDVNEALSLSLSSEDYDSIGGLIIETLDRFPQSGETADLDNGIQLKVVSMDKNKIEEVEVILSDEEKEE